MWRPLYGNAFRVSCKHLRKRLTLRYFADYGKRCGEASAFRRSQLNDPAQTDKSQSIRKDMARAFQSIKALVKVVVIVAMNGLLRVIHGWRPWSNGSTGSWRQPRKISERIGPGGPVTPLLSTIRLPLNSSQPARSSFCAAKMHTSNSTHICFYKQRLSLHLALSVSPVLKILCSVYIYLASFTRSVYDIDRSQENSVIRTTGNNGDIESVNSASSVIKKKSTSGLLFKPLDTS